MAPTFSRPRDGPTSLPPEVWAMVLTLLSLPEKRALLLTCKVLHDVLAPIVYRVLIVHEELKPRPIKTKRKWVVGDHPIPSSTVLSCLHFTTHRLVGREVQHHYLAYI